MKTEYVTKKELGHVLALLTWDNELVMRVCLHTGLRVGDVVALRAPAKRQFWVTEHKTGKRRRVNLTQELVDALNANAGVTPWCFPGRLDPIHTHRTRQAVWADVKRAQKALRLPQNVAPHSARKVYAVDKLAHTGDLRAVQKALNHDDAAVTALYAMAESLYHAKYEPTPGGRTRRRRTR